VITILPYRYVGGNAFSRFSHFKAQCQNPSTVIHCFFKPLKPINENLLKIKNRTKNQQVKINQELTMHKSIKKYVLFFDIEPKYTASYPQNWWITG
jgi:hypothetical protein